MFRRLGLRTHIVSEVDGARCQLGDDFVKRVVVETHLVGEIDRVCGQTGRAFGVFQ